MKRTLLTLTIALSALSFAKAQSQVTFYTTKGNFQVEMYDSLKPITAGNFINLTDSGFYDGIIFHRIISNFVIQGGDPLGTGFGGPGYTIQDEFDASLSNIKKTLSMANSGPNTGGSQFFINLKNNTFLDFNKAPSTSAHPIFGVVYSGWTVCEAIEVVPVDGNDKPITPVVMDSVRVTGSFLSVAEIEKMKTVTKVYPNPISSQSVLDIFVENQAEVSLNIYNSNGALLYSDVKSLQRGKTLLPLSEMSVQEFPAGVYFIRIVNGKIVQQERIIVF